MQVIILALIPEWIFRLSAVALMGAMGLRCAASWWAKRPRRVWMGRECSRQLERNRQVHQLLNSTPANYSRSWARVRFPALEEEGDEVRIDGRFKFESNFDLVAGNNQPAQRLGGLNAKAAHLQTLPALDG